MGTQAHTPYDLMRKTYLVYCTSTDVPYIFIFPYLLYFCFHIPQDNLIVAVMSIYKCWNALRKKDRHIEKNLSVRIEKENKYIQKRLRVLTFRVMRGLPSKKRETICCSIFGKSYS